MKEQESCWARKKKFYASENSLNTDNCKKTTGLNYCAFDEVFFISTSRQHCDVIQRPQNSEFSWKVVLFYFNWGNERDIFTNHFSTEFVQVTLRYCNSIKWVQFFMTQRNLSVKLYMINCLKHSKQPKRIMNTKVILITKWFWKFETKIRILE